MGHMPSMQATLGERHKLPLTYETADEAELYLLPSITVPSDHAPVIADLKLYEQLDRLDGKSVTGRSTGG